MRAWPQTSSTWRATAWWPTHFASHSAFALSPSAFPHSALPAHNAVCCAGVWALLLEATHARLATDVFYVAGDRVVADPLCKPFSMGRNLFCVHSRKHLDDDPSTKEAKQRTNRKTLTEMTKALAQVLRYVLPGIYAACQHASKL